MSLPTPAVLVIHRRASRHGGDPAEAPGGGSGTAGQAHRDPPAGVTRERLSTAAGSWPMPLSPKATMT
jgi:hypothetical protein